jgi:hypothetical protein
MGVGGQPQPPAALLQGMKFDTHSAGGGVGPTASLDR